MEKNSGRSIFEGHKHTEESKRKIGLAATGKGRKPILVGSVVGKLTICRCECGTVKYIIEYSLRKKITKSCGCIWKEVVPGENRLADGESAFRMLFGNYKHRAIKNGIEFKLEKEHFRNLVLNDCHYCGKIPSQTINSKFSGPFIYNGIDRKDSTKGYTLENSVPCCWVCNDIKKRMDYNKFIEHITKIATKHKTIEPYEERV